MKSPFSPDVPLIFPWFSYIILTFLWFFRKPPTSSPGLLVSLAFARTRAKVTEKRHAGGPAMGSWRGGRPFFCGKPWCNDGQYMYLVGGFNHLEKYESQWEGLSHALWKVKNVPNHQPVNIW